jgi:hypothetical protein
VNRFVIRYMAAGHVYADKAWLHGQRLRDKLAVTRPPGARFASVRFVAGKLDPLATRSEFLDLAHRSPVPISNGVRRSNSITFSHRNGSIGVSPQHPRRDVAAW